MWTSNSLGCTDPLDACAVAQCPKCLVIERFSAHVRNILAGPCVDELDFAVVTVMHEVMVLNIDVLASLGGRCVLTNVDGCLIVNVKRRCIGASCGVCDAYKVAMPYAFLRRAGGGEVFRIACAQGDYWLSSIFLRDRR